MSGPNAMSNFEKFRHRARCAVLLSATNRGHGAPESLQSPRRFGARKEAPPCQFDDRAIEFGKERVAIASVSGDALLPIFLNLLMIR